jgi:hypothetical protein
MIHEKNFTLKNRREVKVTFKAIYITNTQELKTDYDILIREPGEKTFRTPIGISHPKYWKLQTVNKEQGDELILLYSGLSRKQLQLAEKEFNQMMMEPA